MGRGASKDQGGGFVNLRFPYRQPVSQRGLGSQSTASRPWDIVEPFLDSFVAWVGSAQVELVSTELSFLTTRSQPFIRGRGVKIIQPAERPIPG